MSVSSVGSSNPYSYLQLPLQPDTSDPSDGAQPSDPLQSLFQSFSGGGSSDPLLAAIGQGDSAASSPSFQFSPDVMQSLLSVQGNQAGSASGLQSLFGKFDADGNGQISESEFENAIGPDADKSKVDALFSKIDGNGDGSISQDEMQSAMQKAHGGHHHHAAGSGQKGGSDPLQALLSGASADGTTSQSATNADGSTTTTLTYADGTKVEMTVPSSTASNASANPEAPNFANLLKQLISLQAQFAAPTTNLSV